MTGIANKLDRSEGAKNEMPVIETDLEDDYPN